MSKESFYRIIIVALLLLNFGVLGYLWMGNKKQHGDMPPHREPAPFIIKSLQLDEAQELKFDNLKHQHQQASGRLREESTALHDALYKQLHNDIVDSLVVDSLMVQIAKNDREKEMVNFNHFRELKTILKPEQYKLYDEFIEAIAKRFGPPPHGKRH